MEGNNPKVKVHTSTNVVMTAFPKGPESKDKARSARLQLPRRKAPYSSYVADVLQRRETEGGQVVGQGLANACCVPALGREGEKAIKVTETRRPGKAPHAGKFSKNAAFLEVPLLSDSLGNRHYSRDQGLLFKSSA